MPYNRHVYHVYAIRTAQRAGLEAAMEAAGIQTGIHYPIPVHLQPAYSDLGYGRGDFPVAERVAEEVLSVPVYPEMTDEQVSTVASAMLEFGKTRICA
jgi:dTDP-4-amino-4,6-dideoxygalactose transaminase